MPHRRAVHAVSDLRVAEVMKLDECEEGQGDPARRSYSRACVCQRFLRICVNPLEGVNSYSRPRKWVTLDIVHYPYSRAV